MLALGGVGAQRAARRERLGGYDVEDAVPTVAADLEQPVDLVLADLGQRPGASAGDHEVAIHGLDGVDRLGEEPGVLPDQHRGRRGRRTRLALGRRPLAPGDLDVAEQPPEALERRVGLGDGGRGDVADDQRPAGGEVVEDVLEPAGPRGPGADVVDDHREAADRGQPDVHLRRRADVELDDLAAGGLAQLCGQPLGAGMVAVDQHGHRPGGARGTRAGQRDEGVGGVPGWPGTPPSSRRRCCAGPRP